MCRLQRIRPEVMQSAIYERSVQKKENPADAATHNVVTFYSHEDVKSGARTITIDRAETPVGVRHGREWRKELDRDDFARVIKRIKANRETRAIVRR
jgi:hypothetical protein